MSAAPQLKLTYFDGTGRAELARLLFAFGGIAFEDERIQHAEMPALKPSLPLGQLPVLQVDGSTVYSQSFAIARYAAALSGLNPKDPVDAMRVDMVSETIRDLVTVFISTFTEQEADKKAAITKKFLEETVPAAFNVLEGVVRGQFFLGDGQASLADVHLFDLVHNALVPVFQFSITPFPKLSGVVEHVKNSANIAAYLEKTKKK
ncbi:Glutathione s-transferase [Globisporangium polare]